MFKKTIPFFILFTLFSSKIVAQNKKEEFLKSYGQSPSRLGDLSFKAINAELDKIWPVLSGPRDLVKFRLDFPNGRSSSLTPDNQIALATLEGLSKNGFYRNKIKLRLYDSNSQKVGNEKTFEIPEEDKEEIVPSHTKLNYSGKTLLALAGPAGRRATTVYVIDLEEKKPIAKLAQDNFGFNNSLHYFEIASNGKFILFLRQRSVVYWDTETGKVEKKFAEFEAYPSAMALSPDASLLAVALQTGHIHILEVKSGKKVKTVGTDLNDVISHYGLNGLVFSPDQKQLLSSDAGGDIKLWDLTTAKKLQTLKIGNDSSMGPISIMQFYPQGGIAFIATSGYNGKIIAWNLRSNTAYNSLDFSQTQTMRMSPDGSFIYAENFHAPTIFKLKK